MLLINAVRVTTGSQEQSRPPARADATGRQSRARARVCVCVSTGAGGIKKKCVTKQNSDSVKRRVGEKDREKDKRGDTDRDGSFTDLKRAQKRRGSRSRQAPSNIALI